MSNKLMKYKGSRGSEYRFYIGKICCTKCMRFGYAEEWYTNVGSRVTTVKHTLNNKTVGRCWI